MLVTRFDEIGYIVDKEEYERFEEKLEKYQVLNEEIELSYDDFDLSKDVEYEEEYWSHRSEDIEPKYITRHVKEYLNDYIYYTFISHKDICEYLKKEPAEISDDDLKNMYNDDFVDYMTNKYYFEAYKEAKKKFYDDEIEGVIKYEFN